MNHRQYIGIIILALVLFGCQRTVRQPDYSLVLIGPATATEKPRTELGFLNDPDNFQFAIIADIHGGNRPGIFEEAVKKINLMQPEFTLCVGDLIAGYTKDKRLVDDQWKEFAALITPLEMKFFMIPGNHDLSNLRMTREWEQRFGRTYYHFIYRNVLFLCLNSEDPPATHISDEQIEYVRKVLVENPDVRWTFTFMHKPLWLEKDTGWERIETMLAGRPHTVLAGHHHVYTKYERHGQSYVRLATTGGGSQLSGPTKGQFDHVTWITVTDRGPIIANLALDGILDENIVTEDSMRLVEHLMSGQWLDIDSIMVETGSFTTGAADIRLTNSGDAPLKVRGTFKPHSQLKLSRRGIGVTIAPRATETVRVEINSISPIKLPDLDPLELRISGVYHTPDRPPIVSEGTYQVDFRYSWQGPELIRNGRFAHLMEGWQTASRTPKSGAASVESEELKVKVAVGDPSWAVVLFQPVGTLKAGVDYQLSFRAKNVGRPGVIAALIKDGYAGSPNIPIRVDGKVKKYQLLNLKTSMTPHTMNFQIHGQEDIEKAIFMFVFARANEMLIDDVSLRSVDMAKAP
jgi:predicted phosphodiesterase